MGSIKKEDDNAKLTPDMAGYRPAREWWPDLTDYRKAILLHRITYAEVDALLKEYAAIAQSNNQITCDFYYTALPADTSWIYLEFPNFETAAHYQNFWTYQNLLLWMSEKADREFCLAIPQKQYQPLFLSTMDKENPYGDSCCGIYADRDFYFEVPGEIFEWGPVPTEAFDFAGFLKGAFQFDTRWIPDVAHCNREHTQVTLCL